MAMSSSIWRPISPVSDVDDEIDVESEGDDAMTDAKSRFTLSENSAFSRITPKKIDEHEESPVDFSKKTEAEATDETKQENDQKGQEIRETDKESGQHRTHFDPRSCFSVPYDPRILPYTMAQPFIPYDPRISAYYMTMARLQLEEHRRRVEQALRSRLQAPGPRSEGHKEKLDTNTELTENAKSGNAMLFPNEATRSEKALPPFYPQITLPYRALARQVRSAVHLPATAVNPHLYQLGPGRQRDPNKPAAAKKYKCDVCDKSFSRSNTLVTHKRIHTGEKPFACEQCGRAFRQPGNLTRHRLTHTTVKPYVCMSCNKAFNRASNLHTHMRTHANLKAFSCHYCSQTFQQKLELKLHLYTHNGENQQ